MTIRLTIPGQPIAKKRPRFSAFNGQPRAINTQKTEEGIFLYEVEKQLDGLYIKPGPLWVTMVFRFKRPKSHFRSGKNSHLLKDSAPEYHLQTPDVDNLEKFTLDCLNRVWPDDCNVVLAIGHKVWAETGGTFIEISPFTSLADLKGTLILEPEDDFLL